MSAKGLGQVAATVIVRYEFTDEGKDGSQLPHRCRSSRRVPANLSHRLFHDFELERLPDSRYLAS